MSDWTDARKDELKQLAALNLFASEIGEKMGFSKNAIVSACHRYKIELQRTSGRRVRSEPRKPRPPRPTFGYRVPAFVAEKQPLRNVPVVSLNIPFADLTDDTCRYATTEESPYLFCGHKPMESSPYCAAHHRLCHTVYQRPVASVQPNETRHDIQAA